MLYLVGLGLGDASDITVKGLEVVRRAARVYLEAYTSILGVGKDALVRARVELSLFDTQVKGHTHTLEATVDRVAAKNVCRVLSLTFMPQEQFYGREVILADRELVEQGSGTPHTCSPPLLTRTDPLSPQTRSWPEQTARTWLCWWSGTPLGEPNTAPLISEAHSSHGCQGDDPL